MFMFVDYVELQLILAKKNKPQKGGGGGDGGGGRVILKVHMGRVHPEVQIIPLLYVPVTVTSLQ